jgi:hypothetical protein
MHVRVLDFQKRVFFASYRSVVDSGTSNGVDRLLTYANMNTFRFVDR